ncbi:hypothetical protein CIG75_01580 [Tumebacillus algifaecis]|uniref:ABC transmembrane type-1 domain-containing protein n=1 Tax=Tumebacillus algifaecis TaxID=1214604 RepID=A0A223CWT8_9BACL|nr:ABC transporter permease subunit [Tumebacillus algifaecis]ASS73790.1 hypothetical protein CIG75_01580 [Tumebacillus algifaecis]
MNQNGAKKDRLLYQLAWVLLLLLVFVAVFGSYLMPYEITQDHKIGVTYETINGVKTPISPPFGPSFEHPLGTDHRGYDVLSLLLNGAKYTLGFAFLVTVVRFVIALPLGLYAGSTGRGGKIIQTLQLITSGVPTLLFVFPTLYGMSILLGMNQGMNPNDPKILMFAFLLFSLLVLIGIFQIAHQMAERARFFAAKEYIGAAKTMGASTSRIVFRHLMPHLRPDMWFAILTDFIQVLFLIGQLAVLNIFLGGGERFVYDDGPPQQFMTLTMTGEWGGMISYGSRALREYPWLLFSAGLFLTLSILILSFFSKQLQKRLARPYLYRTKPLMQNKPVMAFGTAAVAACVLILVFLPNKSPTVISATAQVEEQQVDLMKKELEEQIKKQEERMKETATAIIKNLKDDKWSYAQAYIYIEPGKNRSFMSNYKEPFAPFDDWLQKLKAGYELVEFGAITRSEKRITWFDGTEIDLLQIEIKVKGPNGEQESWLLPMNGNRAVGEVTNPDDNK